MKSNKKTPEEIKKEINSLLDEYDAAVEDDILAQIDEYGEIGFSFPCYDEAKDDTDFLRESEFYFYRPNADLIVSKVKTTPLMLVKDILESSMTIGDGYYAAACFEAMATLLRKCEDIHQEICDLSEMELKRFTTFEDVDKNWPGEAVIPQDELEKFLREHGPFDERKGTRLTQIQGVDREFAKRMHIERLLISASINSPSEDIFDHVTKANDQE